MLNSSFIQVGIDVSKKQLDCWMLSKHHAFPNSATGIARLLKALPPNAHACLEPTGGYERPLVDALHGEGLLVSVVNPKRIRDYARSQGGLAKNDKADARMLADFAALPKCPLTPPRNPANAQLAELVAARDQLVAQRTAHSNASEHLVLAQTKAVYKAIFNGLNRQIEKLERFIEKHITSHADLSAKNTALQKVPGIGALTAATLLALLPELGNTSRGKIAALAGLAPYDDDSGSRRGTRHIQGGRWRVRRALYMASLSAVRHLDWLKPFYLTLRSKGKAPKVALIAAARKLLIFLNSLLKTSSPLPLFTPT